MPATGDKSGVATLATGRTRHDFHVVAYAQKEGYCRSKPTLFSSSQVSQPLLVREAHSVDDADVLLYDPIIELQDGTPGVSWRCDFVQCILEVCRWYRVKELRLH